MYTRTTMLEPIIILVQPKIGPEGQKNGPCKSWTHWALDMDVSLIIPHIHSLKKNNKIKITRYPQQLKFGGLLFIESYIKDTLFASSACTHILSVCKLA